MNISFYIRNLIFYIVLICTAFLLITCSSSKKLVSKGNLNYNQLLKNADLMFRKGNYEEAKNNYRIILDSCNNREITARAQYTLGYIDIYYSNPFGDFDSSLTEFKRYVEMFPKDKHIGLANSWIRLLVVLKNMKKRYYLNADNLQQTEIEQGNIYEKYKLLEKLNNNCKIINDSLFNRIKTLEGVIEVLDNMK